LDFLLFFSQLFLISFSYFFLFKPQCKKIPLNVFFGDVAFLGSSSKILPLEIQIFVVHFQQEDTSKNSFINPLASNCCIILICIDDFITLEIGLNNVLATLNSSEIKDLNLVEEIEFDEFWNHSVSLGHKA
jgi:hypothetical protein